MSVVTKTGDRGWTGMLFGARVRKDDLRVHAVGTLDELNSFLGLARCVVRRRRVKRVILAVQRDLFIVSSELITLPRDLGRLEFRVDEKRVKRLEAEIERLEKSLKLEECCFLIPGEDKSSALLDICRSVARRAERLAATLRRRGGVPNRSVMLYLNRLSDLLYLLARAEEQRHRAFVAGEK